MSDPRNDADTGDSGESTLPPETDLPEEEEIQPEASANGNGHHSNGNGNGNPPDDEGIYIPRPGVRPDYKRWYAYNTGASYQTCCNLIAFILKLNDDLKHASTMCDVIIYWSESHPAADWFENTGLPHRIMRRCPLVMTQQVWNRSALAVTLGRGAYPKWYDDHPDAPVLPNLRDYDEWLTKNGYLDPDTLPDTGDEEVNAAYAERVMVQRQNARKSRNLRSVVGTGGFARAYQTDRFTAFAHGADKEVADERLLVVSTQQQLVAEAKASRDLALQQLKQITNGNGNAKNGKKPNGGGGANGGT